MPVLQTHRLTLREFEPEDVDALATIVSDAGTMRHYPMSFDRADVVDWILRNRTRYANDGYGLWAMVLKSTGELIGDCGLVRQSVDGTDELEIGYHVRRDLWGKGYATEAAQACREYAFANFKVDRLISLIRPENLVSRRIAEKNGMTIWKEVARANLLHYVYAIKRDQTYIAAISEDAMPKTAPAEFSLAQALLTSFDTNDRINHYMIENLPSEAWHAEPAQGKGRTIAAIVAHLHNVRVMWLKAAAKGSKIPEQLDRTSVTPAQATKALEQSRAALSAILKSALESDGRVKGFRPDAAGFFGYLIAHDAHHRGQICMLARQVGHPLPQKVMFGMWEWGTRGKM